ncbi:hypothetical protein [Pseudomonas aeruginosa]|uniref:hypothetical protein n=1 Tax=Pseudomonas aeruginosa TaxID=287 RepID=UPI003CF28F62
MLSGNPIHALLTFLEGYLLHTAQHPSEPFDSALKMFEGLANADPPALSVAGTRLSAAERALTEHGTE